VRIKRLELVGFKSSKDRTVLDFPEGITGIVGPNGCGKSNIVDALRWVLGEQSARHLRGKSMEDVIFVGNQTYGPLGMAEVSILLDNEGGMETAGEGSEEDNEIVRALRKAPELRVTRRLYRSGESEYLINDRTCRLRDITELFLGTGVGTKAYSIVEQGRVGQIVGAKPEELRLFIEEAAGTTLYRSRKVAAERKIERTRDNLLRVSDIVRELERQANSLRRQARGAVQYQELRTQEDSLDRAWTIVRLRGVEELQREAASQAAEQSGREHALRLEIARAHEEREGLRERGRSVEVTRESARQAVFSARSALSQTEQERRHLAERRGELEGLVAESGTDLGSLEQRIATLGGEAGEAERRRTELALRYEEARATCETVAARVRDCDERYFAWSSDADAMRTRLIEALGASAALRNECASVARQLEAASARESRLVSEDEALATVRSRLHEDLEAADEKLAELARTLDVVEGSKRSAADELDAAQTRRALAQVESERSCRTAARSARAPAPSWPTSSRSKAGSNAPWPPCSAKRCSTSSFRTPRRESTEPLTCASIRQAARRSCRPLSAPARAVLRPAQIRSHATSGFTTATKPRSRRSWPDASSSPTSARRSVATTATRIVRT
jgi:chromosome segregation protein